jgi:A/G-specific adenine glycosylase
MSQETALLNDDEKEQLLLSRAKQRRAKFRSGVLRWSKKNFRDFPWRINKTPYRIMVAEFLLKRTTASAVMRVYEDFLQLYPDLETLAAADQEKLSVFLKTLGYYKKRARMLIEVSNHLLENYHGVIPDDVKVLASIPNIGHYTAGAISSLGYGIPAAMMDSNVERILKRVFATTLPEKAQFRKLRSIADLLVPKKMHDVYNLTLLDLGAAVCSYRWTKCLECPLRTICDSGLETTQSTGESKE